MDAKDRIIVALDVAEAADAMLIVEQTAKFAGYFKVGLELIASQQAGKVVEWTKRHGGKIFYDAKLNDIPNTVGRSVAAVSKHVEMVNVHALCGLAAMRAAVESAGPTCKVLAVTILTSLAADDLAALGIDISGSYTDADAVANAVWRLAKLAKEAGVHGLICSARELEMLKREGLAEHFLKVIPGIRPEWAAADDQKRVMTPGQAIAAGADFIVVGRPITKPPSGVVRAEAAKRILDEVAAAYSSSPNSGSSPPGSASSPA